MELLTTLTPLINRIALDVIMVTGLGAISALLLVTFSARFRDNGNEVVTQINRTLPQTQCAQCGYPGCLPYAEAIAAGESINKCPPGGDAVIHELATLLGRPFQALDSALTPQAHPTVAYIREEECIGCTLCIAACPIDAIIGAPGLMHTVLSNTCTGCDLCLEPCPVDCNPPGRRARNRLHKLWSMCACLSQRPTTTIAVLVPAGPGEVNGPRSGPVHRMWTM
jgi:Na+-translocating ferredoxin:NAD+ oxidoreductase subunit B